MTTLGLAVCMGSIELRWIPLGAGGHLVRWNGLAYEALKAFVERRPRRALFHSALEIVEDGERIVVEVTPIPREPADRGVVGEGPVGMRWLGSMRWFRYEVRAWRGGEIPDARFAVGGPIVVSDDPEAVRRLLGALRELPLPVWGRDELRTGEMWNSNSVVSWLLARAGVDLEGIVPPAGGRSPGWDAGILVARRQRGLGLQRGPDPNAPSRRSALADEAV